VGFPWPIYILVKLEIVPYENIGKNLEKLCIGQDNLEYLNNDIANPNVKIIGYPNLLSG
jgi:hypothetical protein